MKETCKTTLQKNLLASNIKIEDIVIDDNELILLMKKFKDNYRAILNYLFDNFKE